MFASQFFEPRYGQEGFGFHQLLELQHHKHEMIQPNNKKTKQSELDRGM